MTHRLPTWIGADVPRWAISPVQAAFLERFPAGAVVVAGVQVHGDVLGQRCRSLSASRVSASRAWSTVLAVADTACATSRGTTGAACPRTGFSVMARRPAIVSTGCHGPRGPSVRGARFATGHRSRRLANPRSREQCPEGAGEAGEGRGSGAAERRLGAGGRRAGRVAQHGGRTAGPPRRTASGSTSPATTVKSGRAAARRLGREAGP